MQNRFYMQNTLYPQIFHTRSEDIWKCLVHHFYAIAKDRGILGGAHKFQNAYTDTVVLT